MAILTSSVQTFVDLTDQRKLSSYLTSNLPTVQIKDPNNNTLNPNWETTNLKVSPVIYLEQELLTPSTTTGLTVSWRRKEGSSNDGNLVAGETANSDGSLSVNKNILNLSSSKIITYICRVSYNDPDTLQLVNVSSEMSFALIQNASNTKVVTIEGEQVFKYDKDNNLVGSKQITLTANAQNVSISKWQYKNASGAFVDYPTTADNANITSGMLIVKPNHTVFNSNIAIMKITTADPNISDVITITKLYDGGVGNQGEGGLSAVVGNESELIPCTNSGLVANNLDMHILFYGYKGVKMVPINVTVSGLPTGMTVKSNTPGTASSKGTLILTAAANSNLGGANVLKGQVTLTFSIDGAEVVKYFTWCKAIQGEDGVNSVILTTYTPNGNVIQNSSGSVLIQAVGYNGATQITSNASYAWKKYVSGSWSAISGATSSSLTVTADMIVNVSSFECTMTFPASGGKAYKSIVTVMDKTDPCVSEMIPIGGTTFKNGLGGTAIYVIVRRNNTELDPLKGPIKTTAPTSPKAGDFWWEINEEAKTAILKKYSGSAWVPVTTAQDKQILTYNWYKRNKNGENDSTFTKTDKVIYFTAEEVDSIATLQCDVSDSK